MNTTSIKLFVFATACLAAVVLPRGQNSRADGSTKGPITISEVKNYRKMFRVNEKPIDMVEATKMMCAPPAWGDGPHYDPGVVYYINEVARDGLKSFQKTRLFPLGSIIVKEKQERRTDDSVQIITVMKKVQSGGSEDSWEYRMYDTRKWVEIDFSKGATHPASKTCIECHRRYKDNDYISNKGIELLLRS